MSANLDFTHSSVVTQYSKALSARVLRFALGAGLSATVTFAILAGQLGGIAPAASVFAGWLAALDGHLAARGIPLGDWLVGTAVGVACIVVLGPVLGFQFTRWRLPGLKATAILPDQRRTLLLHLGADKIFALLKQILETDTTLYDLRFDEGAGLLSHIVFITAFDEHAIAAFESGAIDYVLKPVDAGRLATTIARLKSRLSAAPPDLGRLLTRLAREPAKARLNWVQAATGNKLRLITVDEILCFQTDAKYTKVLTREAEALIRKPIKELADELDLEQFWQIHRSTIVNIRAIDVVQRHDDGRMDVSLCGRKERFAVSQTYQHRFRQM
jgi:DNA-binding LytR/AlgR family response regulator